MGLYTEMLDEGRILKGFVDCSSVLMVTCPGCACESISYSEGLPCRSIDQGKNMEESAIAIHNIRDRWESKLKEMGLEVNHVTVAFPCGMFDTDRELIKEKISGNDCMAVLACSSGFIGIKDMLPDFLGNFVPMMKTVGTSIFRLVKDESGENSIVDQETARIIYFNKERK